MADFSKATLTRWLKSLDTIKEQLDDSYTDIADKYGEILTDELTTFESYLNEAFEHLRWLREDWDELVLKTLNCENCSMEVRENEAVYNGTLPFCDQDCMEEWIKEQLEDENAKV